MNGFDKSLMVLRRYEKWGSHGYKVPDGPESGNRLAVLVGADLFVGIWYHSRGFLDRLIQQTVALEICLYPRDPPMACSDFVGKCRYFTSLK